MSDPSNPPAWCHEPIPRSSRRAYSTGNPRLRVLTDGNPEDGYHLFVQECRAEGPPQRGKSNREDWMELRPPEPIRFPDLETARAQGKEFAANIRTVPLHQWTATPLPPPSEKIQAVEHPDGVHKALVVKRADGRLEARYFVYEAICVRPDGTLCEWEWLRIRRDVATFAGDLDSALQIAAVELEELARTRPPNGYSDGVPTP